MTYWNHRIVHYRAGGFGIHEVYYDDQDRPWGMTEHATGFAVFEDESPDDLLDEAREAIEEAASRPVLDEPEEWPGQGPELPPEARPQ